MIEGKIKYYKEAFSMFLTKEVPDELIHNYINEIGDNHYSPLSDFIGMSLKKPISEWTTNLGIVEAVDLIVNEAIINGNIKC